MRQLSTRLITAAFLLFAGACSDSAKTSGDSDGGVDLTVDTADTADAGPGCATVTCSGNGMCLESTTGAVCLCDAGYDGDTCDECAVNFRVDGEVCVPSERCTATSCAGNGDCDDGTGLVVCDCEEGYAEPGCASCDAGFHRDAADACVRNEGCDEGDPCLAGTCDDSGGVVECLCFDGYEGVNCQDCYPGYERNRFTGECQLPCAEGPDFMRCDDGCRAPNDVRSCGGCGNDCGDGICSSFACQCPLVSSFGTCDELCTSVATNEAHCGACGDPCEAGESCVLGRCLVEDGVCAPEGGPSVCPGDDVCCFEDYCYFQSDIGTDELNCGGCGVTCLEGEICVGGACAAATSELCDECRSDEICCDDGGEAGVCLSTLRLLSDRDNCAGCGVACDPGQVCSGGLCFCPEETCEVDGTATCVDTSFSADHCGACNDPCDEGDVCVLGACVTPNGDNCDEACEACCEAGDTDACLTADALTWSEDHCGACGNACGDGESCVEGECVCDSTLMAAAAAICDDACTPLGTDSDCADCGDACEGGDRCVDGVCGCPEGSDWDVCDDTCTFVGGDIDNCRECAESCEVTDVCDRGSCCTPAGATPVGDDPEQCCSGQVDEEGMCAAPACLAPRARCSADGDAECCQGACGDDGRCCLIDGSRRASDDPPSACCTGDPDDNGICGAQSATCRVLGGACLSDSGCCSQSCSGDGACCLPNGSSYADLGSCCEIDDDLDGRCGGVCVEEGEPVPPNGEIGCCLGFSGDGVLCGGELTCGLGLTPCETDDDCCNTCTSMVTPGGVVNACCAGEGFDLVAVTGSPEVAALLVSICCNGDPNGDLICGTATCVVGGEVAFSEDACCDGVHEDLGGGVFQCGGSSRSLGPPATPCLPTGQSYARSTAECCDHNDPDFDGRCGLGLGACGLPRAPCIDSCCSGTCSSNGCCLSDGMIIDSSVPCCTGNPDEDVFCGTASCVAPGDLVPLGGGDQCCSGSATAGVCDDF